MWTHVYVQLIFILSMASIFHMHQSLRLLHEMQVTCDFDSSNKSSTTRAGSSHTNEMCNLYAMV